MWRKNRVNPKSVPLLALGVVGVLSFAACGRADITYTTIDVPPGNHSTQVNGIDGSNIVGTYYGGGNITLGFLYNGSTYTTLGETSPQGISGGNIVGSYFDVNASGLGKEHGFIYNYNGSTFVNLDDPLGSATWPQGSSGPVRARYESWAIAPGTTRP